MDIVLSKNLQICESKIISLLRECLKRKDACSSYLFHSFLSRIGFDSIGIFQDHLIRAYASCGSLKKCSEIFLKNAHRSLYTWNVIMEAHVQLESSEITISLFNQMRQEGICPDKFSYLSILKACSRLQARRQGCLLHAEVICKNLETDNLIVNTLVDMYAKCGFLEDSCKVFDAIVNKDLVAWNALIGGYVGSDLHVCVFELTNKMIDKGFQPNEITFIFLLKACNNKDIPKENKYLIHHRAIRQGIDSMTTVGNSLIDMYGKYGYVDEAQRIFQNLEKKDLISWNSMLTAYLQQGQGWMTLNLFEGMQKVEMKPDNVSFSCILQACGSVGALEHGMFMHYQIILCGMEGNLVVAKMLLDMYAKCGKLSDACKLFKDLRNSDVVPWNSLMAGYTKQGDGAAALILFRKMQQQGLQPDDITYSWILKACVNEEDFETCKTLHDEIVRYGLESNPCICSGLVEIYAKCGIIEEGQNVFDQISDHDLVLWNTLMAAYVQAERPVGALQLFEKMCYRGVMPDNFTFSCIVKASSELKNIKICCLIHDKILRSQYEHDNVVGNSLIDMYGKLGCMKESKYAFECLSQKDIVSWNAFITGCVQLDESLYILQTFQRMQEENIEPDGLTFSCVLRACINIGALREGRLLHDQIVKSELETLVIINSHLVELYTDFISIEEGSKTVIDIHRPICRSWNAVMEEYSQRSPYEFCQWIIKLQWDGMQTVKGTYVTILQTCARVGAITWGRFIHDQLIRNGSHVDLIIGGTLIDMYGKCGCVDEACVLFNQFPNQDLASWNALIGGYMQHGDHSRAVACFHEMRKHGFKPDHITYSNILAAFSRSGKAQVDQQYLRSMMEDSGIIPDIMHFTSMVLLLSNAGRLDEAEFLLKSVPNLPDAPGWRALLFASKLHGGLHVGTRCYQQTVSSYPEDSCGYVLVSSI